MRTMKAIIAAGFLLACIMGVGVALLMGDPVALLFPAIGVFNFAWLLLGILQTENDTR